MHYCRSGCTRLMIATLLTLVFARNASAEIFYDISVKGIYEDNVVGLLSDGSRPNGMGAGPGSGPGSTSMIGAMGSGPGPGGGQGMYTGSSSTKNGDLSVDLSADLGVEHAVGSRTALFLEGSVERISYNSFTELNMTAAGVSSGMTRKFGDVLRARLAVSGVIKRFEDSLRDASLYSASIILKEQLSSSWWLRQSFLFEKNNADSPFFTYAGRAAGIRAGYLLRPGTTVFAGYHYLVREYREPPDFEETAHTLSFGWEWEPVPKWFIDLQYDRRATDTNLPGTYTTANIVSLGVRYSY